MELWLSQLALFIIAFVANFLSAMAGGGAGLLQLPALIFLGLPFATALGTHKIASVALGLGASSKHLHGSSIEWRLMALVVAAGVPGVILGAHSILLVPEKAARITLGLLTIGLGVYSISKRKLGDAYQPKRRSLRDLCLASAALFFFGFLNGSLTSGTGLFVTLWSVLFWGLDYRRALAITMLAVGLVWNATGALTLGIVADIQWSWLPVLLLASFIGGYAGSHVAIKSGNALIKRIFECTAIGCGIALIWRSL